MTLHGNEAERRRRVEASSPLETGRSSNVCSVDGSNSTPPSGGANSGVGADEGRGGEESVSQVISRTINDLFGLSVHVYFPYPCIWACGCRFLQNMTSQLKNFALERSLRVASSRTSFTSRPRLCLTRTMDN